MSEDIAKAYAFVMVFHPPDGAPVKRTLSPMALQILLADIHRQRPTAKKGRRLDSRDIRLRNLLKGREVLRANREPLTQRALLQAMGHRGDPSLIRQWLQSLNLTWEEFKAMDG